MMKLLIKVYFLVFITSCAGVAVRPYRVNVLNKISNNRLDDMKVGEMLFSGDLDKEIEKAQTKSREYNPFDRRKKGRKAGLVYSDQTSLSCRAGFNPLPDGKTIEQFLRNAINSELKLNEAYNEGGNPIHLEVRKIENNSVGNAHWHMDILYNFKGNDYLIETKSSYKTAFGGVEACTNATNAFESAIQDNIYSFLKKL